MCVRAYSAGPFPAPSQLWSPRSRVAQSLPAAILDQTWAWPAWPPFCVEIRDLIHYYSENETFTPYSACNGEIAESGDPNDFCPVRQSICRTQNFKVHEAFSRSERDWRYSRDVPWRYSITQFPEEDSHRKSSRNRFNIESKLSSMVQKPSLVRNIR